jgi:hypothetical protein
MISKRRGSSSKGAINKKKTKLGKKVVMIKLETLIASVVALSI